MLFCLQQKGTNEGDKHTRVDSVSEYLPGRQLQQTESPHEGCFCVYIQWVLASQQTHLMFLVSPHPSPFILLPSPSKLFEGLPNGVLVCLLLCTIVDIPHNADEYVADRRSCCQCGTPFAFHTASQSLCHSYLNLVIILILSWIMTYLHMLHQCPLCISTLLSFRINFTLIVSVKMSQMSLARSFLVCITEGIDIR